MLWTDDAGARLERANRNANRGRSAGRSYPRRHGERYGLSTRDIVNDDGKHTVNERGNTEGDVCKPATVVAAAANGALSTYQWRAAACALIIHVISIASELIPADGPATWRIHGVSTVRAHPVPDGNRLSAPQYSAVLAPFDQAYYRERERERELSYPGKQLKPIIPEAVPRKRFRIDSSLIIIARLRY